MKDKLIEIRKNIDIIDDEILKLYINRLELVKKVADIKKETNTEIQNETREEEILKRIKEHSGEYEEYTTLLFEYIMKISRDYQYERNNN